MHTCTYTYMHLHEYVHTYIHTYIHTFINTYTNIPTYMHAYIHTCMHTYIHTCMHTYIPTNTHAHTHTHTHPHTHTHTCACICAPKHLCTCTRLLRGQTLASSLDSLSDPDVGRLSIARPRMLHEWWLYGICFAHVVVFLSRLFWLSGDLGHGGKSTLSSCRGNKPSPHGWLVLCALCKAVSLFLAEGLKCSDTSSLWRSWRTSVRCWQPTAGRPPSLTAALVSRSWSCCWVWAE